MNILITAFEPFGNRNINNSLLVLNDLIFSDYKVTKIKLPVVFLESFIPLKDELNNNNFDYIFLLGEAPYDKDFTLELEAHNIMNSKSKDNKGNIKINESIYLNEEYTLTTKFNINNLNNIKNKYNLNLSNNAGSYICNSTYYQTLHYLKNKDTKCIFIHISNKITDIKEKSLKLEKIIIDLINNDVNN